MSSNSPRERVSTPEISGRIPVVDSIAPARASIRSCSAPPTVPWPSRPTLNGVTCSQVLVAVATHYNAGVAITAEDHRRTRDAVVVVGHRVTVCPGGRRYQYVAGPWVVEQHVLHQDVPRLAVLAGDRAERRSAEAVRDLGLVARVVEHRPQVVGHAAVHRHVRAHLRDRLHGA